jgi:hypothetical protein
MSGSTPELSLATPEGTDDSRNYLIVGLGNALTTLDSLFNATTGHNHSGPHQGGPIAPDSLVPPVDLPGVFRSTNSTGIPSAGAGLEMYYDPTGPRGVLQAYDRDAGAYRGIGLWGSSVVLATGGTARMTVQADGHVLMGAGVDTGIYFPNGSNIRAGGADAFGNQLVVINALTVTPGRLHAAGLTVNGATTFNGSVSAGTGNDVFARYFHSNDTGNGIYYADVGDLYLRPPSGRTVVADQGSFICSFDISAGRNMGVTGNIQCGTLGVNAAAVVTADLTVGGNFYVNTNAMIRGGTLSFEGSGAVRIAYNPGAGRLDIPYGNGIFTPAVNASAYVTSAAGAFDQFGTRGYVGVIKGMPGRGEVQCFVDPTGGQAVAMAFNELNHHDSIIWVNGRSAGTQGWSQVSSRRSKSDVVAIDAAAALRIVSSPHIESYRFVSKQDNRPDVGFLAEEWAEVLPEAIHRDEAGEVDSMTYSAVTPILYAALKAVLARLDALEEKAA